MSYLKRPILTLVLNRFKQVLNLFWTGSKQAQRGGALGEWQWRSTVDNQREGNYLSVLRTNQKRMEATLGPRIFPRDRNVQQLYAHSALNTSFYPFHCAIITLPLSRDRNVQQLYTHCALNRCFYPFHCTCHYRASTTLRGLICAHPTSTLRCHWDCGAHDSFQGVVPMLYDFTSAWPFLPRYIVLVRAPTRCACFKHT